MDMNDPQNEVTLEARAEQFAAAQEFAGKHVTIGKGKTVWFVENVSRNGGLHLSASVPGRVVYKRVYLDQLDRVSIWTRPVVLAVGDQVTLPARADGVAHRDGNEAVWEIVDLQLDGELATLHLVGADASRTCGAATKTLRPTR